MIVVDTTLFPTWFSRLIIAAAFALSGSRPVLAQAMITPPIKVSAADFQKLRFLEGKWRGTGYKTPFFETYRFVNDSTIESGTSEDAGFATVKPGSLIVLRDGSIYSEDGGKRNWAVTRIDSAGFRFAAIGRQGFFVWKTVNPNEWMARLENGTLYRMYRIN